MFTPRTLSYWLVTVLLGCVSNNHVAHEYREAIENTNRVISNKTTILFLVDGFSVADTAKLSSTSQIKTFFQNQSEARALFPTMTYPNISSILTSHNLEAQPILGNKILINGELIDFESAFSRGDLNDLLKPLTVFNRLKLQHRTSLSIAPVFGEGATAHYGIDLDLGTAYQQGDYRYIDQKLLASLDNVLGKTRVADLPDFIFVHLIGVDGYSHKFGINSQEVSKHLKFLDESMSPIFQKLTVASDSGREISAILTSDHGMVETKRHFDLDSFLERKLPQLFAIRAGRYAAFKFLPGTNSISKTSALKILKRSPAIEAVIERTRTGFMLTSSGKSYAIDMQNADCGRDSYKLSVNGGPFFCPQETNIAPQVLYPYLVTNLASYFRTSFKPDIVILAAPNTSFDVDLLSDHGGMTPEEVMVPFFSKNYNFQSVGPFPTFRLLENI